MFHGPRIILEVHLFCHIIIFPNLTYSIYGEAERRPEYLAVTWARETGTMRWAGLTFLKSISPITSTSTCTHGRLYQKLPPLGLVFALAFCTSIPAPFYPDHELGLHFKTITQVRYCLQQWQHPFHIVPPISACSPSLKSGCQLSHWQARYTVYGNACLWSCLGIKGF